ncbi:unnamed protein product, partial [Symbiodinium sp. CCMP2456]
LSHREDAFLGQADLHCLVPFPGLQQRRGRLQSAGRGFWRAPVGFGGALPPAAGHGSAVGVGLQPHQRPPQRRQVHSLSRPNSRAHGCGGRRRRRTGCFRQGLPGQQRSGLPIHGR